jgi:glutathione synthase/RimK-type ligase-like ATP-grasp enzyme
MTKIAFLACKTTLPDTDQESSIRRKDAFEHDLMVANLEPAFRAAGMELAVIGWEDDISAFDGVSLALLGTVWNYQDHHDAFLAKLDALEKKGVILCNSANVVRWNSRKTYLRELADKGAATIPTLWLDDASGSDIASAFEQFGCDKLVIKRQIGAGAEGQLNFSKDQLPPADWQFGHKAMVQPFLSAIQSEGEYSFIFIGGAFSHALRKVASDGEYRIQSVYGGTEQDYSPSDAEVAQAAQIVSALPFDAPLYARIDMVRADDGNLQLMEAEMIEPFLYPQQGPQLGERLATEVAKRIG